MTKNSEDDTIRILSRPSPKEVFELYHEYQKDVGMAVADMNFDKFLEEHGWTPEELVQCGAAKKGVWVEEKKV